MAAPVPRGQPAATTYYNTNPTIPGPVGGLPYTIESPELIGTLNQYRNENKQWETIYSAYIGGPLIKDKLFMFLAAETSKTKSTNVEHAANGKVEHNTDKNNKFYGKLDWNITDNNILELTVLKNRQDHTGCGSTYNFDYDTLKSGEFVTSNDVDKDNAQFYIGHFTSYITDDGHAEHRVRQGQVPGSDHLRQYQHVAVHLASVQPESGLSAAGTGPNGITNNQTNFTWSSGNATNNTHGLRVDFDYKLGDHDLAVGIDNMNYGAKNQGPSVHQSIQSCGELLLALPRRLVTGLPSCSTARSAGRPA